MRAFIGIFPPAEIKKEFRAIQDKLSQYKNFIRFVDPAVVHITLKYLGNNVNDSDLIKLVEELKIGLDRLPKFSIRLNEVKFGFRKEKWPRILFVSVLRNDSMNQLSNEINDAIDRLSLRSIESLRTENNVYHFTLGRKKKELSRDMVNKINSKIDNIDFQETFVVKKVDFISSILSSEGPKYSNIDHIRLKDI